MDPFELSVYETREEWLGARGKGIGASEVSALFGASKWDSPVSLWTKKRGIVVPSDDSEEERLEIGLMMEPVVAAIYEKRTERQLWAPSTQWAIARSSRVPCMTASIDRWVIKAPDREGRGVLEIKNVGEWVVSEWDDGPPLLYQIQLQAQLAVTGFQWGSIAGLMGGNRFKWFDFSRNDDFIGEMEELCKEFWGRVERGEMPSVDASEHTTAALKALHPADNGKSVTLTDEHAKAWSRMKELDAVAKEADKEAKLLKNQLLAAMGPNTFGELPDGRRFTLKTTSNPGHTAVVQPYTYRVLRMEAPEEPKKTKKTKKG